MDLLGWFRKRKRRYTVILALVSTLAAACRDKLPEEKAVPISALAAQIQEDLKRGTPDQKKIKSFVRMAAQASNSQGVEIQIPENLQATVSSLANFYTAYDNARENSLSTLNPDWKASVAKGAKDMWKALQIAESNLGLKLEQERNDLRDFVQDMLDDMRKSLEETGKLSPYSYDLEGILNSLK